MAKLGAGRTGQAFEFGEPDVMDLTTANSLATDHHGPRQDDQVVKTKTLRAELLAGSGSEPGANASPLIKEPAARMAQHDGQAISRVGWTSRPFTVNSVHFA